MPSVVAALSWAEDVLKTCAFSISLS